VSPFVSLAWAARRLPEVAALAALTALASSWIGTRASAQETPARVTRVTDPSTFSSSAALLGFRGLPEGSEISGPLGVYGVHLCVGRGGPAHIWLDREQRCFPPLSAAAVCNVVEREGRVGRAPESAAHEGDCALGMTFDIPVNRVAFELRGVDLPELNAVLRCFWQGRELGRLFFDLDQTFSYVGLQSTQPFDELRIELTNPSEASLSLDNVLTEFDLRDRDMDGVLDFADACPDLADAGVPDSDGDGMGDLCDPFPLDPYNDWDGDGLGADIDNCPYTYNPGQADSDHDGIGNLCDVFPNGPDSDGDGIGDLADNCPTTFNPEQADCDLDGIGDVCDPTLIEPPSVSYTLAPGESVTLQKSVCLPPAPPVVDVAILFDTTGSMGGEIANLRLGVSSFVDSVRASLPQSDVRFGLAAFRDYPGRFDACGYSASYGLPSDRPFQVVAPLGSSNEEVLAGVQSLHAEGGQDRYESYGRALWELTQPDSGIGFRSGAARFVLLVGDSAPHDCNLGLYLAGCVPSFTTGRDPGRDGIPHTGDEIDFQQDTMAALLATNTHLFMIYTGRAGFCAWERWAQATGGEAIQGRSDGTLPPGTNLVQRLVRLIRDPEVNTVEYAPLDSCGLEISFDPPRITGPIDVSLGARVTFLETIRVPDDMPAGTRDCTVRIEADGVLLGEQQIHVDTPCQTHVLDFETEDDGVTPLLNGQAIASPPGFGRFLALSCTGPNADLVAFDSTPGGPNSPAINSDMLIGHGNLLLLQDDQYSHQSVPGIFDVVTDDPQGGDMVFDFLDPVDPRSVLLVDINPPPNLGASVTLVDAAGRTRVYAVDPGWTGPYGDAGPRQLSLATSAPQPGYGTRRAVATEQPGFEQARVVRIVVHMTGSGAIDDLTFCR